MINKLTSTIILTLCASTYAQVETLDINTVEDEGPPENKTRKDMGDRLGLGYLYHKFDYDEVYGDVPDVINMTEVGFWFSQVHWATTGFMRGFYQDNKIESNPRCFGEYYLMKTNQYVYTFQYNPFDSFFESAFPMIYMTYMLFFMVINECGMNHLFNDYSSFCWYKGCWPQQFLYKLLDNFLYILRAINDAAIVWKEGLDELSENPDRTHVEEERDWAKLSAQTA
jgi:hypothetical protein